MGSLHTEFLVEAAAVARATELDALHGIGLLETRRASVLSLFLGQSDLKSALICCTAGEPGMLWDILSEIRARLKEVAPYGEDGKCIEAVHLAAGRGWSLQRPSRARMNLGSPFRKKEE
uniref:Uncharacterized protein n=2 Tax=Chloebia gouldiae TaxID=44316 RepID=A0A3L8RA40_CHLGU|nr:hypothetical protein DV515_00016859 [Chloebia gouldiae]